jgi:hypothetical protein
VKKKRKRNNKNKKNQSLMGIHMPINRGGNLI